MFTSSPFNTHKIGAKKKKFKFTPVLRMNQQQKDAEEQQFFICVCKTELSVIQPLYGYLAISNADHFTM